jgi:hypothetical protein
VVKINYELKYFKRAGKPTIHAFACTSQSDFSNANENVSFRARRNVQTWRAGC